ncbi:MAG: aromatic-ring-hydroxylating dioxygenase subunit beta [Gemmatimonas sp.]
MTTSATRAEVEDFLFLEADLLDNWRLDEWLGLFAEDGRYEIPATDLPDGDPARHLFIIADSMAVLRGRVQRLKSVAAYSESPRSRTRRIVGNVRLLGAEGDALRATANFIVQRVKNDNADSYCGRYDLLLRTTADGLRFVRRRAVLDLDALRPQGRISFIL